MTNFLHIPKDLNPSKKTWMWLGLGAVAAVGVGVVYYRNRMCALPPFDIKNQGYSSVHTTGHPDALTEDQLKRMKVGDRVGVAVGIRDKNTHNILLSKPVKVVPGKLTMEGGTESYDLTCFRRSPRVDFIVTGPLLLGDGEVQRGFEQYVGRLFPINKVGTVIPIKHISTFETGVT